MMTMFEYYASRFKLFEDEFGTNFLISEEEVIPGQTTSNEHPIKLHWREATRFLRELAPTQRDCRNSSLAFITLFGDALEASRRFPGFDTEIRQRLRDATQFDACAFEMYCANLLSRSAKVEFFPRANTRTPDLKVIHGNDVLWVECQRKNLVEPMYVSNSARNRINLFAADIMKIMPSPVDVQIIIFGFDEHNIINVMKDARKLVLKNRTGGFFRPNLEASFSISRTFPGTSQYTEIIVKPENTPTVIFPLNSGATFSYASCNQRLDDSEGRLIAEVWDRKRMQLYVINSHTFTEIENSFKRKIRRGQISQNESGMLVLKIDLNNIDFIIYEKYITIMMTMIKNMLWKDNKNRNIGTFSLSHEAPPRVIEENGYSFLQPVFHMPIMARDNASYPKWTGS